MRVKRGLGFAAAAAAGVLAAAGAASAAVATVDISGLYNGSWGFNQGFYGVPTGSATFNGVPFQIGDSSGTAEYAALPDQATTTILTDIYGATQVYSLINTFWGMPGPTSYLSITFNGDAGATQTFDLIGGVDIRDFNNGGYQNTINGTTTQVAYTDGGHRLDEQTFTLDPAFRTQTLTSIVLDDTGWVGGQEGVLTGLSVASGPAVAAVPEPATWAMLILGVAMIGFAARRSREALVLAA